MCAAERALRRADKTYQHFDMFRDRDDQVEEVRRLTKVGVSSDAIAALTGMSQRTVTRLRSAELATPQHVHCFDTSDGRATQLERTADTALDLACRIRDEDPRLVWEAISLLSRQDLQELTMVLLAALPVDETVGNLLGWVKL